MQELSNKTKGMPTFSTFLSAKQGFETKSAMFSAQLSSLGVCAIADTAFVIL